MYRVALPRECLTFAVNSERDGSGFCSAYSVRARLYTRVLFLYEVESQLIIVTLSHRPYAAVLIGEFAAICSYHKVQLNKSSVFTRTSRAYDIDRVIRLSLPATLDD